jgi:hypothetical protein
MNLERLIEGRIGKALEGRHSERGEGGRGYRSRAQALTMDRHIKEKNLKYRTPGKTDIKLGPIASARFG